MIVTLNVATIYEDGVTVEVWTEVITDAGTLVPAGEKLAEAIVNGGQLTYDLPQDGRMYTLAALVEGAWQIMRVTTSAPGELTVADLYAMIEDLTAADVGAEAVVNKDIDPTMAANSDVRYPSQKAVATALATKPTAALDTDATMAANSDARVASQKATKTALATKPTAVLDTDSGMAANSDANVPSQKAVKTALALKESTANKGVAGGYASLEAAGKVPIAQLPAAIMEYQGAWNANTNTPALADGTGNTGDTYRVSVAGERNLGSGAIEFQVGDYVIYNNSGKWEKSDTTDAVASVAGKKGVVTLATADIEGLVAALAGKQASDADLTAIAELATQAFGRELLTKSNAEAARTALEARKSGPIVFYETQTFTIPDEIAVAAGDVNFLPPIKIALVAGQTSKIVKVLHRINSGTSATVKLQKNGADLTGFTGIEVKPEDKETDPADQEIANGDKIALVVTAVSGTPKNMTFSVVIQHSVA